MVGDRVTLEARTVRCEDNVELAVLRVGVNKLGQHVGPTTRHTCANPCQIHDRRTKPGGYDYQIVVFIGRKQARSRVVRVVWAQGGSGSGGGSGGSGGGGSGGGGGGSGGGGSGSQPAKWTLDPSATDVSNAQGTALTIDPNGDAADLDHTPDLHGGAWRVHYSWQVPGTLVAGQRVVGAIALTETISDVSPDQDLSGSMNTTAPDFAQELIDQYHMGDGQKTASDTYDYTLAADTTANVVEIVVGFEDSFVRYTYRRTP
jgi:hypothetical protein